LFRQGLCRRILAIFGQDEVWVSPIHDKRMRDHFSSYGEGRPIAVSFPVKGSFAASNVTDAQYRFPIYRFAY
jgi:hypothetical protein